MYRKVDELGRIVIPINYRRALDIKNTDEVEVELILNEIIIRKPVYGCVHCNAAVTLVRIGDLFVCRACIERLHNAKNGDLLYSVKIN